MNAIPKRFANGVEFFRKSDLRPLDIDGYFACIDALRPLLSDAVFRETTPGFYLNSITVPDDNGLSLRVVYYSLEPTKTQAFIREFVTKNSASLALCDSKDSSRTTAVPSEPLDEEDHRFFSFLNTNTQIFLEVSKSYGVEPLRALVYAYRHVCLPSRIPPEALLEWAFSRQSDYFVSLKREGLDRQYWADLVHLFHSGSAQPDCALHFLVNMSCVKEGGYAREFFDEHWLLR